MALLRQQTFRLQAADRVRGVGVRVFRVEEEGVWKSPGVRAMSQGHHVAGEQRRRVGRGHSGGLVGPLHAGPPS